MDRIKKIIHQGKEIILLDYSGCKTEQMITLINLAKQWIEEKNQPVLVLSIFHKNYVTPEFMRHVEKELKKVEHLIDKNAIIGLSAVQKWILLGVNLWYTRQIHHFDSYEKALEFLVSSDNPNR